MTIAQTPFPGGEIMTGRQRIIAIVRGMAIAILLSLSFASRPVMAGAYVVINDPTGIQYAVQDNKVYLRNMNVYDSAWLPCCYNYWIDLSTDNGKAQFSALLAHKLSGKKLNIYKNDFATAGPIDILGDF
jgi:hypothetical protein